MSDDGELRVVLVQGLNNSPAAVLAVKGWLETVAKGWGDGELNMSVSLNAFVGYAKNGRDVLPVGVITWNEGDGRVRVFQSYVEPEFRGRGVYSAMWLQLVNHVAEHLPNVRKIQSATHVRNSAMREIAKRQGRSETGVILSLDIPR